MNKPETILGTSEPAPVCVSRLRGRSLGVGTISLTALLAFASVTIAAAPEVPTPTPASVTVFPKTIKIRHRRQPHSLHVSGSTVDGYSVDLHDKAKFASGNPNIARVDEQGWIYPVASGKTQVTITVAGQTRSVPIEVELPKEVSKYSFRHEVMPVLSKSGCNMGACHGYSLGKNGFKLSLRGADPEKDYEAITRDSFGRRRNIADPEESLLVTKPNGVVPHEGAVRFPRGGLCEDILVNWIAQGCPDDRKDPARVTHVQLVPDKLVLRPEQKYQLQLIAHYNDGSTRDVTNLSVFNVNNDRFSKVGQEGLVVAGDLGETAIVARFERKFAATSVLVLNPTSGFEPTPVPADNLIDRAVVKKLNRLKITPSGIANDETFLRRVYLDLIGLQPTPDEIRTFLSNKDPKKREKIVDGLFKRPEFVDHWSLKWGDLLQNSRNQLSPRSVFLFREFIRSAVASNMPVDKFARKILTARGGVVDDPASAYFAISKDTNDTVERVTQVFCGVRMLCARCHAHPMENWTQGDYYGLASFFSQVRTTQDKRFARIAKTKVVQLKLDSGFARNPRTNLLQPPRFLGGKEPKLDAGTDRREAYAKWLTSPDNEFFARGIVNRFWSYFFHRGIIDPVDDIRSTNPPINPELLDALTKDFVAHKFDLRHLMQRIVTSATYQRSSIPTESNKHDHQNFSHAVPRRIPAEALLDSLVQATGVQERFGGAPGGFRAAQLPDANVTSPFLKLFGKPQRMDACECERDNSSNMLQALHFINGKSILGRVQNGSARPAQLMRKKLSDKDLVTELYLWSLARHPNEKELQISIKFIESYDKDRIAAAQDLMWALLNSRDFLLNH